MSVDPTVGKLARLKLRQTTPRRLSRAERDAIAAFPKIPDRHMTNSEYQRRVREGTLPPPLGMREPGWLTGAFGLGMREPGWLTGAFGL